MFSDLVANFIANAMKIEINSIESKLNEVELEVYKTQLIEMIEYFTTELIRYEPNRTEPVFHYNVSNEAEDAIKNYAIIWMNDFCEEDKIYQIIDTLRHAFSSFAFNGLHQLYTRQENEDWYPKVVLTDILEPNDIDTLEDQTLLYRGCDISEYENGEYGQAWSTSEERANDFAFRHYASQSWFNQAKRTVLKTIYPRDKVLFSDQKIEHEVVIQPKYIIKVEKHNQA